MCVPDETLVPETVAAVIARRPSLFLMSMGSGAGCDAQYLFSIDILGAHAGHYLRHSKTYRDFRAEYNRLQQQRVAAYTEYRTDVETGVYPAHERKLEISETEMAGFLEALESEEATQTGDGGGPWMEIATPDR